MMFHSVNKNNDIELAKKLALFLILILGFELVYMIYITITGQSLCVISKDMFCKNEL